MSILDTFKSAISSFGSSGSTGPDLKNVKPAEPSGFFGSFVDGKTTRGAVMAGYEIGRMTDHPILGAIGGYLEHKFGLLDAKTESAIEKGALIGTAVKMFDSDKKDSLFATAAASVTERMGGNILEALLIALASIFGVHMLSGNEPSTPRAALTTGPTAAPAPAG